MPATPTHTMNRDNVVQEITDLFKGLADECKTLLKNADMNRPDTQMLLQTNKKEAAAIAGRLGLRVDEVTPNRLQKTIKCIDDVAIPYFQRQQASLKDTFQSAKISEYGRNKVIAHAKGILSAAQTVSDDRAFRGLVEYCAEDIRYHIHWNSIATKAEDMVGAFQRDIHGLIAEIESSLTQVREFPGQNQAVVRGCPVGERIQQYTAYKGNLPESWFSNAKTNLEKVNSHFAANEKQITSHFTGEYIGDIRTFLHALVHKATEVDPGKPFSPELVITKTILAQTKKHLTGEVTPALAAIIKKEEESLDPGLIKAGRSVWRFLGKGATAVKTGVGSTIAGAAGLGSKAVKGVGNLLRKKPTPLVGNIHAGNIENLVMSPIEAALAEVTQVLADNTGHSMVLSPALIDLMNTGKAVKLEQNDPIARDVLEAFKENLETHKDAMKTAAGKLVGTGEAFAGNVNQLVGDFLHDALTTKSDRFIAPEVGEIEETFLKSVRPALMPYIPDAALVNISGSARLAKLGSVSVNAEGLQTIIQHELEGYLAAAKIAIGEMPTDSHDGVKLFAAGERLGDISPTFTKEQLQKIIARLPKAIEKLEDSEFVKKLPENFTGDLEELFIKPFVKKSALNIFPFGTGVSGLAEDLNKHMGLPVGIRKALRLGGSGKSTTASVPATGAGAGAGGGTPGTGGGAGGGISGSGGGAGGGIPGSGGGIPLVEAEETLESNLEKSGWMKRFGKAISENKELAWGAGIVAAGAAGYAVYRGMQHDDTQPQRAGGYYPTDAAPQSFGEQVRPNQPADAGFAQNIQRQTLLTDVLPVGAGVVR